MSSIIAVVIRQKFTKFLHDVATSSPLVMRTFRQWYCNSFSSDSVKNASGINRRSRYFLKIIWLPWQRPLTYWKTRHRTIVCTQSTFIWWKDCKNWSSISWDIRLNTPVFAMSYKQFTNEPRFLWSYWTKVLEIFTRYRGILSAVNAHIEVAICHSVLTWQRSLRYRKKKVGLVICNSITTIWCKDCENRSSGSWDTSAPSEKIWYDTKLVAMATSLEISEKEVQIVHLHPNALIRWKDCENRSSGSWDNLSPRNH